MSDDLFLRIRGPPAPPLRCYVVSSWSNFESPSRSEMQAGVTGTCVYCPRPRSGESLAWERQAVFPVGRGPGGLRRSDLPLRQGAARAPRCTCDTNSCRRWPSGARCITARRPTVLCGLYEPAPASGAARAAASDGLTFLFVVPQRTSGINAFFLSALKRADAGFDVYK